MTERTDRQYQTFVRRLVEKLDTDAFPNSMTPEERVGVAVRMTDALLDTDDFKLTDENVSVAAAIIWAFDNTGRGDDWKLNRAGLL